jgi:trigger factor
MNFIQKKFYKSVLSEEINGLISKSLNNYLKDENIALFGEPLPSENASNNLDFDNQEEFEISFDLGIRPTPELKLNDGNTFPFYKIIIDNKMLDSAIENLCNRYGELVQIDVVEEESTIQGDIEELNPEGSVLEGGIKKPNTSISLRFIDNIEEKQKFIGAVVNQTITFNPRKSTSNDTDFAAMLGIENKEKALAINSDFQFTVTKTSRFEKALIDKELFDKIFPMDNLNSEEEFRIKVKEMLAIEYLQETNYKFIIDTKKKLVEETSCPLPVEFLKRWLRVVNESKKMSIEMIESEFGKVENEIKWEIIRSKIIKDNDIQIDDEDLKNHALEDILSQFRNYGIDTSQIPKDVVDNLTSKFLEKEENLDKIKHKILDQKAIEFIKMNVALEMKEITLDEFYKIINEIPAENQLAENQEPE